MIKIIIHGHRGKMGKTIIDLIKNSEDAEIVAGIDSKPSNNITKPFPEFDNINNCDMPADVIIDFSLAIAVPKLIDFAVKRKIPLVICTTGLSDETNKKILDASKEIPIFKSANMSLGINIIANILGKISGALYNEGFDIEIIEKHHNLKVDAPSGTAFLLGDTIKSSVNDNLEYNFNRSDKLEKRNKNEIGIHSVRGGTIVGEHEVIFAGKDEVLSINHTAYSKELFAVGAVKASKFIFDKKPGIYNMKNLVDNIF